MALTDWEQLNGAANMGASDSQAETGSFSFNFDDTDNVRRVLENVESRSVAPTEGKIETQAYKGAVTDDAQIGALFRIQDADNYIALTWESQTDGVGAVYHLVEVVNGSATQKDSERPDPFPGNSDAWEKHEYLLWEDPADTINARMLVAGSQVAGTDLSYTGVASALSTGGGIGLGTVHVNDNRKQDSYVDETEVFEAA